MVQPLTACPGELAVVGRGGQQKCTKKICTHVTRGLIEPSHHSGFSRASSKRLRHDTWYMTSKGLLSIKPLASQVPTATPFMDIAQATSQEVKVPLIKHWNSPAFSLPFFAIISIYLPPAERLNVFTADFIVSSEPDEHEVTLSSNTLPSCRLHSVYAQENLIVCSENWPNFLWVS